MVVGYVRISTKEQNTARQDELMKSMGITKIFTDKCSGKDTNRPKLHEMLEFVREGDTVVVESISRLARNTKDLFDIVDILKKKGVMLVSKKENIDTTTPNGQLIFTILVGLAQFERECILERQAEGIAIAKQEGRMRGRPRKADGAFETVYLEVRTGQKTATQGARELGISRATWYRRVKEYNLDEIIDFG